LNKAVSQGSIYLFKADRGNRKGESLLVCSLLKAKDRKVLSKNPFADKLFSSGNNHLKDFLTKPAAYTEYRLVGAEKLTALPSAGILGIHYIKVKPDRSAEFDRFVAEKLNPTVGKILSDLQLLYYKAVDGDNVGTYITIFALASTEARDSYWPGGTSETKILKDAFIRLTMLHTS